MEIASIIALCILLVVLGLVTWILFPNESIEDKYPNVKFNLKWFCCNPPIPEKNGRMFGKPARAVFEALACKLQMPTNQIEQMLGGCMVFGTIRYDHYKDVCGNEYTVDIECASYSKLYGDKTKKGLNGMVGMDCQGKY